MIGKLIQALVNGIMKPHGIVIATLILSVAAWSFPDFTGFYKGYEIVESVSLVGLVLIYCWYALVIIFTYFAFNIGKKLPTIRQFNYYTSLDSSAIYRIYSIIGIVGFGYTLLVTLQVLGINGFIYSIVTFTTNRIAEAIYEDYQAGIFSFRYVLIISFGWAMYRMLALKKVSFLDIVNVLTFVFYIAFFGRRLQLVCSLLIFAALTNKEKNFFGVINVKKFIWLGLFGFAMLSAATLLRNYGSYEKMGYSNPLAAVFTNILSYLAAPFQVSLGVGNNVLDAFGRVDYRAYTDVDSTLTANSAFAEMVTTYGLMAITRMAVYVVVFGMLAGWLSKNRTNYLYTGYPIILYAFAEVWRIELFNKGIFFTLLLVATAVPVIFTLVKLSLPLRKTQA